MAAAKMAGINVLRLITEPVAAAVAYTFQHNQMAKSTVLVYDLGGGAKINDNVIEFDGICYFFAYEKRFIYITI